jgi:hypothetical protein
MTTALLEAVVKSLAQLVIAIDLTDDEEVDPDLATTWFEDVAYTLNQLPQSARSGLAALVRRLADEESDPVRRNALLEFPESFGLDEEDE